MHKIDEIEALRAYSVLSVVLFHFRYIWFGWVGVWVFFVISGFVITLSLAREPSVSRLSVKIGNFYRRRFLRIGPLYIALIIFASAFFAIFGQKPPGLPVVENVLYLMTATYNFYRLSEGYIHSEFFGHYWSLCVEEQFYVLYPLAFYVLSRRRLTWVLLAFVLVSPLLRGGLGAAVAAYSGSAVRAGETVYLLSFLHFDAFALGCLAALYKERIERSTRLKALFRPALLLVVLGGVAYLAANVVFGEGKITARLVEAVNADPKPLLAQVALYSLISVFAVMLIVGILIRDRIVLALTCWRPLQRIGEISFGIYMFHFPILFIYINGLLWMGIDVRHPAIRLAAFAPYLAIVIGVSALSFRFFEKPVARHLAAQRRFLPPASAV